jgi:hypothetical protein
MEIVVSAEFQAYLAAEKNLDAAKAAINELADTLSSVATILRNNPTRFTRPNPNYVETRSDGRMLVDEPDPIDLESVPEPVRSSLVKLAQVLIKAQKDLAVAKAALPPEMASRLTRPRA